MTTNWQADLYQGEVVRVDPDDAEVWVVSVLTRHLLQDFQEFKTIYGKVQRSGTAMCHMTESTGLMSDCINAMTVNTRNKALR